ncbi:hypothetical protein VPH35_129282 [Triticum aestivum]
MRLRCGVPGRGPLGGAACRGCCLRCARRTDASARILGEVVTVEVMARRRPLLPVQEIRKRNPLRLLSPTAVTMVVVKSTGTGMKTALATGSRANHRWCLSFGAPGGQPACSAAAPPNPLAKGRPNLFLLALKLYGRQCYSSSMFTACCGEELVGPSGDVPGAGEFGVDREWLGPDCVPLQIFGVLSAYFRDCVVIFSLLCVLLLWLVLPYCNIK